MHFQAAVIGGGINGLATLYHLIRRGVGDVALFDQFRIGHDRGSSHGHSRVTRSTYADADYVRLMQVVHNLEWPALEKDAGRTLVHRNAGCFWGPAGDPLFDKYRNAVTAAGANVEHLTAAEGRQRFPQFRFPGSALVLHDHTAGLVAAAETIGALREFAIGHQAKLHEETRIVSIDPSHDPLIIQTDRGDLTADRLVVTAGSWTSRLVPSLRNRLAVRRQTVGYFRMRGPAAEFQLGRFPVWIYLEDGDDNVFYGLPEYGRPGIKLARHRTAGGTDDPNQEPASISSEAVADIERFLAKQFTAPVDQFLAAEHCLYTNTFDEDFILDFHPNNSRIVIGAGFSGHGFKFGPLTGRILAELALDGKTSVPEFEAVRAKFAFHKPQDELRP